MTETLQQTQPSHAPIIGGLSEVSPAYDFFILDIFGVIHNGIELYPQTIKCLSELKAAGKQICLLSNTPRRRHQIADDLTAIGLDAALYDHIITAGDSAYEAVKKQSGKRLWFAGTERFEALLEGIDIELTDNPAECECVLNAIDGMFMQDKQANMAQLQIALDLDIPMICANPDLIVNIGDQTFTCAGTYADWYLENGGTVSYHGKPHEPVYEQAWEFFGRPDKSKIIAVGDALKTDIQGANRFDIDSIFNLTGIHWEEVQLNNAPGVVDSLKLADAINKQPYKPRFIMCGFTWS